jgi:hypothetical protein
MTVGDSQITHLSFLNPPFGLAEYMTNQGIFGKLLLSMVGLGIS